MDKLTYTDPTSDFRFKRILAVSLIKICSSLLLTNCSRDVRQSPLPFFKLPFKPFNSTTCPEVSGRVRTADPPDYKSGCSKPTEYPFTLFFNKKPRSVK